MNFGIIKVQAAITILKGGKMKKKKSSREGRKIRKLKVSKTAAVFLAAALCAVLLGGCEKSLSEESAEIESIGEDEAKTLEDIDWRVLYLDYLIDFDYTTGCEYRIIYANDDEIPELVINTGSEAGGNLILTISDHGNIDELWTKRLGFVYVEKGNILDNHDGSMDHYYDDIYEISDTGEWELVASGTIDYYNRYDEAIGAGAVDYIIYEWEGTEVSEKEYLKEVEKYVGEKPVSSSELGFLALEGLIDELKDMES